MQKNITGNFLSFFFFFFFFLQQNTACTGSICLPKENVTVLFARQKEGSCSISNRTQKTAFLLALTLARTIMKVLQHQLSGYGSVRRCSVYSHEILPRGKRKQVIKRTARGSISISIRKIQFSMHFLTGKTGDLGGFHLEHSGCTSTR